MVLECNDFFISDIKKTTKIDNVMLIEYNGQNCMVRMLDKESYIRKYNPQLKYIIRFGKSNDKGMKSIEYIAITMTEYKDGLKKRKAYLKSLKSNNTLNFTIGKNTKKTLKKK